MSITLVLGIGNRWRGDDAAGLLAADALRAQKLPGVTIIETTVVDPALIDVWQDVGRLIVVDVVMSGAAVGTVHRLDLSRETFFTTLSFCSTHAFDLSALLNLARALDRLPQQVWVFGIEVGPLTHGHPVNEEVMFRLGGVRRRDCLLIVDGAPAARFVQHLRELVESGYSVDEQATMSASENLADSICKRGEHRHHEFQRSRQSDPAPPDYRPHADRLLALPETVC